MKKIILSTFLILGFSGGVNIFAENQAWEKDLKNVKECQIPKGYEIIRTSVDANLLTFVETKKGNEFYVFVCRNNGSPYHVNKTTQEK